MNNKIKTLFLLSFLLTSSIFIPQKSLAFENLFSVDANTIALWRFNDSSGSLVTDETGVNNGTAVGTTIVDGKFGKARYFNGSSDYIVIPDNPSLGNLSQITIEAWIYPQGFDLSCWALDEGLVIKGDTTDFYASNAYGISMVRNYDTSCRSAYSFRKIRFDMNFGWSGVSSFEHDPNQWYYVVGTFDGQNARIYVNGTEENSGTFPARTVANSRDLYINHHTWGGGGASSQRMRGLIDEIRIPKIASSAQEIAYYYNLTVNQPPIFSSLNQFKSDATSTISEGGITTESSPNNPLNSIIVFKATLTDPDNDQVKLQIELKEKDQDFNEQNLLESDYFLSGSEIVLTRDLLIEGQYKWRARAIDDKGNPSQWMEFDTPIEADFDFEVKLVPLYTQVESDYPSRIATKRWADLDYGTGNYSDCFTKEEPRYSSISRCGCAITSMVMLGRYYKIDTAIDSSNPDPLNINTWLTNNKGYRNLITGEDSGNLNWGKAIEYLGYTDQTTGKKMAKLSLDYHNATSTLPVVENYIASAKPVIAYSAQFGHYFIVDGKIKDGQTDTYTTKDPRWYNTKTLNQPENLTGEIRGYNNYFDTANLFSYLETPRQITASMYLYLASPAEFLITDPQGRKLGKDPIINTTYGEIPNGSYTEEGPIASSDTPLDPTQIHRTKVIYIPTPIDGNYDIRVIGTDTGSYTVGALTYDNQGNSQTQTLTGNTQADLIIDYNFNFTPDVPENIIIQPEDTEPPLITHTPINNQYILNSASLSFEFSAQDVGVGVYRSFTTLDSSPIANGQLISFNRLGSHKIEIIAEDFVGNTATKIINFDVIYRFSGFLPPIKSDNSGVYKLGRTLPVKFQLTDANNVYIPTTIVRLFIAKISNGIVGTDETPSSTSNADTGNIFRYDELNNQYIYNLSTNTLSVGSWQLKVILDDNRYYTVVISIK